MTATGVISYAPLNLTWNALSEAPGPNNETPNTVTELKNDIMLRALMHQCSPGGHRFLYTQSEETQKRLN